MVGASIGKACSHILVDIKVNGEKKIASGANLRIWERYILQNFFTVIIRATQFHLLVNKNNNENRFLTFSEKKIHF